MNFYRKHWYDVGGVLAMILGASLLLFGKRLSRLQMLSALNFGALFIHQLEEYRFPGYFPGQFNGGLLKSETPDRYPLNTNSAMIINTGIAYTFYALPVLFPKKAWLGLAPILFGLGQALAHGIVFPRLAKARYSPGFLAALFLHVPIGILYIRELRREQTVPRSDWIKAMVGVVLMGVLGIAAPQQLLKDKDSPYRFTPRQLGAYAVDER